jgi:hypothetical protein
VAVIRATASAQDCDLAEPGSEFPIPAREIVGIAGVEHSGLVELRVTARRAFARNPRMRHIQRIAELCVGDASNLRNTVVP